MLGANLPVAAGLADLQMEGGHVMVAYFGEGASSTGDFHEALHYAGVTGSIVICENNQYACRPRRAWRSTTSPIAQGYGFDGVIISSSDVLASTGRRPSRSSRRAPASRLIGTKTYRWRPLEHDRRSSRDEELAMESRDRPSVQPT